MAHDPPSDDDLAPARQQLYGAPSEDFLSTRSRLVTQAKAEGAGELARRITALRKPTLSAAFVNRLVHADPNVVDRLRDMGSRLREAQEALDVDELRELSVQRRRLVAEVTAGAFETAPTPPSATIRDEVAATFDAAVADPDVTQRLGSLVRPERYSGFGVAETSAPSLTLVRGPGSSKPTAGGASRRGATRSTSAPRDAPSGPEEPAAPDAPAAPVQPRSVRRATERKLQRAREAFIEAETALTTADSQEAETRAQVTGLVDRIAELTAHLETSRRDLEQARRAARAARTRRREARSALDRAERQAGQ